MYSSFQLAKKYFQYLLSASNRKGHGVHSPFVFSFITRLLRDKKQYPCYTTIESVREKMLGDQRVLDVEDFGAGSTAIKSRQRIIQDIARSSLKPKKYGQLLYRMAQYYQPSSIIELGTSLGITTAYLASGNPRAAVYTCEGAPEIAAIARENFRETGIRNIELIEGDFAKTLQPLLQKTGKLGMAFIDGNHRKEPTLDYFQQLLAHSDNATILIFDDIHWSEEMEAAWSSIQQHPSVTLTIDLFFIGIVCMNDDIKVKQHFKVLY